MLIKALVTVLMMNLATLVNPAEFRQWAENPLTVAYRQYLKDRCLQMAMAWAQGQAPSDQMQAHQTQAECLGDLAELECNDVRTFYGMGEIHDDQ